ncbi:LOW QUALITY PROTEIN: hypothetical protein Cgig2_031600 [Carnegiea gigantea]|uniref:Uncharacterized protein n=1 Tax=Carnegiea gigantea TaxID=171969 RepID=A0A9Q1KCC7_9CARY|nr:LOW QUALITY PROTEIN: hypothetical protein Cgig2_031600 [Carnegiea gigantea]
MRLLGSLALFCGWRSSVLLLEVAVLLPIGGRRCYCRLEVTVVVAGWRSSVLLLESLALFCGGLLYTRWRVIGQQLLWFTVTLETRLILSSKLSIDGLVRIREEYFEGLLEPPTVIEEAVLKQLRSALGQAVNTIEQLPLPLRDVMSSGIRVPLKHDVSIQNLRYDVRHYEDIDLNILDMSETREEEESDEEEEEEKEEDEEEFEDFISDEDEELHVGDMCLDDSEDEDDNPDSDDESTPSNTTPNASASPNPTPGTTSIPNCTSPLPNLDGSPFSFPRIQTLVFNSEESPQLDMDASCSISSAVKLENPPNLDSSTEVNSTKRGKTHIWLDGKGLFYPEFHGKVVQKITEIYKGKYDAAYPSWRKIPQLVRDMWFNEVKTQATQSTQATFDGSTPSTPSEPSYDKQMKIWIDANGLTKRGRLCDFGPDIYTNSQGPCSIQNRGKAYTNTFATLVDENKRQEIELHSQKKVLDDVKAKLTLDKKQTKKVQKYAKATQDIQAQMFQWHSLMKTIIPNLPPSIPVIDSLSESEDGGEDDDDDGGGGVGGVDE